MLSHFGHFVQRPSGISRLRDLPPPSLGFLVKPVSELDGGGVTAGSTLFSKPNVFLVNEVVAIKLAYFNRPRATVHAQTSSAPCARKTLAQALVVAPVVRTSSTNTTRLPLSSAPAFLHGANARGTFVARSVRVRNVWARVVALTRRRSLRNGMQVASLSRSASRSA